jgi:hypothetical protein
MNEEPFEQAQGAPESAAPEPERDHHEEVTPPSIGEAVKEVIGAAKQAVKAARSDAGKAAQQAVPIASKAAKQGVYDVAYGVAFVASFGAGVISRMAPDSLKTGVSEGAVAGNKAAHDLGKRSPAESNAAGDTASSLPRGSDEAAPA